MGAEDSVSLGGPRYDEFGPRCYASKLTLFSLTCGFASLDLHALGGFLGLLRISFFTAELVRN